MPALGLRPTVLRARVRQGAARVRRALVPVALASLAAGAAWAVAHYGLGHEFPFFAPVSAWVALGFSADRHPRRVAELAVGVAIGVALGDLLVQVIGTGALQIAVVLAVAALVARFLDRGALLTTQAGVQAVVLVGLPAAQAGSPLGRWLDAAVGGAVALLVTALWPQDPRRRVRSLAEEGLREVSDVLRHLADGLATGDAGEVEESLVRGRASEPVLDQWRQVAANARQAARVAPAHRRHLPELGELEVAAVRVDRAMRNARVLSRRARVVVEDRHDTGELASLVADVADAADTLGAALAGTGSGAGAREALLAVASRTDPWVLGPDDMHVQALVLQVRSLVVDLAEAAGVPPARAREVLPDI